ncbi:MAG TPA: monovalent cation:proton antiporter-2 (CPA2) family protein [Burkholderiales bacterium]|nr:monovalent cation:proton antiporter-2 (CPA2) family protein [Burkholderiales bacterium]
MTILAETAIFLAAAVVAVPLFRRFRLGAVLGYLAAGVIIGPWCLKFVTEVENILHFAELGVALLLFVIGLELQPSRLWVLRRSVFGLGGAQVLITGTVLGAIALAIGTTVQSAVVVGLGLAMSSTAFVLQILAEKGQLTARHGRSSFAILLFQDLAVIPLLALIPLLGAGDVNLTGRSIWLAALTAIGVIVAVVVGGRYLLRPILHVIAASGIREIFTAATLLVVIGTSLLMTSVGLSMSLGAFLAGVLLADSEYRHELEADIEPFKGLLLGLFFISVGMSADLGLIVSHPFAIVGATAALMAVKAAILLGIGRISGHNWPSSRGLAVALCQGGEFAFVLFGLAAQTGIMDRTLNDSLVIVVTLSMALTPLAFVLNDVVIARWLRKAVEEKFDEIDAGESRVIIAGFGRVGQIVGRLLRAKRIPFTALDKSAEQVETVRRFGSRAYYGDASRLDMLLAAKADKAEILVLAIDDIESSLRTAETAKKHFPKLRIYARARNRFHAHRLMDVGVDYLMRETYGSSLELTQEVLRGLGLREWESQDAVATFRSHDEQFLASQHAVYHDETKLIQSSKDAVQELESLLQSDTESDSGKPSGKGSPVFSPSDVR